MSEVTKAQPRIPFYLQAGLTKDLHLLMPSGIPQVTQTLGHVAIPQLSSKGSDKEATEIRRSHAVQSCRGRLLYLYPDTWEVD